MLYHIASLVCLLTLIDLVFAWDGRDYVKKEHSLLQGTYGTSFPSQSWMFSGSTVVTSNFIRLTPDSGSKQGMLWNRFRVQVNNWELQMQFQINGKGKDLFGDGMAIWYVKDAGQPGPVFGSKDLFSGLAVMLDTYSNHNGAHNHQHPYISAMINNGSAHYDHDRDGTHTQLAGCESKFRGIDRASIAIRYISDELTVSTNMATSKTSKDKNSNNDANWKECLRVKGVRLPTGYFIGVSASTGDLSDNHDVFSIHFYELDGATNDLNSEDRSKILPSADFFESPRAHIDDPKPSSFSGVKTFLIILFLSILLVVCAVFGIMYYQKHQDRRMKRFY